MTVIGSAAGAPHTSSAPTAPARPHHPQADELLQFCRGQLAGYKCPKTVDLVSTLPRNGAGKILKRELREHYQPN